MTGPGPPDRRGRRPDRGWAIAWTLAVTQTVGYGVLFYAFGVFTVPMEAEFGWTRAQTSGAFSLALLTSGLAALGVGRLVDLYGGRGVMTIGSLAAGALVLAWSAVHTLPQLYAVQAGIGLAMAAVTYEVAFAVVARWFRADRIRALLVVTMVAGLASTIFVPLATLLVQALGWRDALRALAVVLWVVTVPLHAAVLRRAPGAGQDGGASGGDGSERDEGDRDADGPEADVSVPAHLAWRGATFWWLATAFALDRMAIVAIGAHAVPLLLERGFAPGVVAGAVGAIGVAQVAGRLAFAPATDRQPLWTLAAMTYLVRAAALVALLSLPGLVGLAAFALLFGASNGASTLARAGLVAETYGGRHYGTISGAMTTLVAVLQTAAPIAVGALRVATGGYLAALLAIAGLALGAAAAVDRAARASRRAATGGA